MTTITATTATLPGPSRPSLGPPDAPLPSLPLPTPRRLSATPATSGSIPTPPDSRRSSSAFQLPTISPRTLPSSLPPRPRVKAPSSSTPAVPTVSTTTEAPAAANGRRPLRKTISIGAFPQPPKSTGRVQSQPVAPLSASAAPAQSRAGQRHSEGARNVAVRDSTLKTPSARSNGRGTSLKSPLTSPTLLDGSGDNKSVSSSGLLSPPSPSRSRTPSAQGSYSTSATTFDGIDEDEGKPSDAAPENDAGTGQQDVGKDGKGNVVVSVRARPDAGGYDGGSGELEWMADGRRSLVSYQGREGGEYYYDNVFAPHDSNARVYDAAAKRLVRRVMEGYHGTVFAYGVTGTGKTFSMQGTANSPGVIPMAITDIFSFIRETPHREFLLRVSYLEIYNEKIYDLLSGPVTPGTAGQATAQEEIRLREDPKRGVYAMPLKEEIVQSPTQLLRVIARGDGARRVSSTQSNARSSRSHAVVQIVVESRARVPGGGVLHESKRAALVPGGVRVSTLSLIDLAGSERAAENKERRTEGAHINKSLLTLGTVIARLSGDRDKQGSAADREKHLPYRDSKLTRLLQLALSGNSLVSILCTIQLGSAGSSVGGVGHTGETLNTLKFASRAKNNLVSHAKRAEEAVGGGADAGSRALLDRYRTEIAELRRQLHGQSEAAARDGAAEKARELEAEQRREEQMLEMRLARAALRERIDHLNRLILSSQSLGVSGAAGRTPSALSTRRGSLLGARSHGARPSRSSAATLEAAAAAAAAAPLAQRSSSSYDSADCVADDPASPSEAEDGQAARIRALRADLADRNRYIATLERRLLQARRAGRPRASAGLAARSSSGSSSGGGGGAGGGAGGAGAGAGGASGPGARAADAAVDALLRHRDDEIRALRASLDERDGMLAALRAAARARGGGGGGGETERRQQQRQQQQRRDVEQRRRGSGEQQQQQQQQQQRRRGSSVSKSAADIYRVSAAPRRAGGSTARDVDEVTRLLDDMLAGSGGGLQQARVDSGVLVAGEGGRGGG